MSVGGQPEIDGTRQSGAVAFASYAYPPNALGYCGPGDPAGLLGTAVEGHDLGALRAQAERFEGAWPYLQLIAGANGIDDPLDRRVVDAYWIGNSLLEGVTTPMLLAHLDERFQRRAGRSFTSVAEAVVTGGAAHHSFHVFAVYPWLGLLRAGREGAPMTVLDQCRVRWGTVLSVEGDLALVKSQGLTLRGHALVEGSPRVEQVRRSVDGMGFGPGLAPGDHVALHWDWICRRLSAPALERLIFWTRRSLHAVNTLPGARVAAACEAGN
jgi:uncharacterized protein DUF6390